MGLRLLEKGQTETTTVRRISVNSNLLASLPVRILDVNKPENLKYVVEAKCRSGIDRAEVKSAKRGSWRPPPMLSF